MGDEGNVSEEEEESTGQADAVASVLVDESVEETG